MDMKKFNEILEAYNIQSQNSLISDKDFVFLFHNLIGKMYEQTAMPG
jgi:hypothetical protein